MDLKEFDILFKKELKNNDIILKTEDCEKFYIYMKEIIRWNEKINLTAIINEEEFLVKHFIDSLTIEQYVADGERIIDIGTGAGFPGIPLKIANPYQKITLIDSINKKLNVIRDISKKIGIEDLEIIHTRAEDLAIKKEYRESYDFAITRAVSKLCTIVEYMLPFVKLGGKAICMKGPNIEEELYEAQKAIKTLGGKIESVEKILIDNKYERNVIIIDKEKITPSSFPRSKGKPVSEPIK